VERRFEIRKRDRRRCTHRVPKHRRIGSATPTIRQTVFRALSTFRNTSPRPMLPRRTPLRPASEKYRVHRLSLRTRPTRTPTLHRTDRLGSPTLARHSCDCWWAATCVEKGTSLCLSLPFAKLHAAKTMQ